jgi:toxin CcdB
LRQFDLIENPSERSRSIAPYFIVLQSHHLEALDTVIVAPLLRDARRSISSLDIDIEFLGEKFVIALGELFSIERALLRTVRGSTPHYEDEVRRALDRIFTGF